MDKQGNRRSIISCSSLIEFTEIKIAGKRRIEPEWSSQTGAARIEQSDWSSLDGAGWILGLGHHFVKIGSSDGSDAREIISLIYIVR